MKIVVACFLGVLFALGWPKFQFYRDASFHRKIPDVKLPPNARSGIVTVRHSAATLRYCEDAQGPLPDVSVTLAYKTTFDAATCDPGKHVLLVHGTGLLQDPYWWTGDMLRAAGEGDMVPFVCPRSESKSMVDRVQAFSGACVTTFDLRGHGHSEVTDGPWSTKLLAADIAAGFKLLHPGQRVHANGLSLGYGVALSLAFNYPDVIRTVSGSGFLADRSSRDWAPYVFSRSVVVNAIGLKLMATAAEAVIVCAPSGSLYQLLQFNSLDGFARASASWLHYNERAKLPSLSRPLLWMHPILDDLGSIPVETVVEEFNEVLLADKKLVVFNATGKEDHCHQMFDPDTYFTKHLMEFVLAHAD